MPAVVQATPYPNSGQRAHPETRQKVWVSVSHAFEPINRKIGPFLTRSLLRVGLWRRLNNRWHGTGMGRYGARCRPQQSHGAMGPIKKSACTSESIAENRSCVETCHGAIDPAIVVSHDTLRQYTECYQTHVVLRRSYEVGTLVYWVGWNGTPSSRCMPLGVLVSCPLGLRHMRVRPGAGGSVHAWYMCRRGWRGQRRRGYQKGAPACGTMGHRGPVRWDEEI